MPNWKSFEARDKLLAAVVASLGAQSVNYSYVAKLYGEGATYHAVEGQFRPIRKMAEQLKANLENGVAPTPATPKANGTNGAGRGRSGGKKDGVISGRVTKANPTTPSKVAPKPEPRIKDEHNSNAITPPSSFDANSSYDGTSDMDLVAFGNVEDLNHPFSFEDEV